MRVNNTVYIQNVIYWGRIKDFKGCGDFWRRSIKDSCLDDDGESRGRPESHSMSQSDIIDDNGNKHHIIYL